MRSVLFSTLALAGLGLAGLGLAFAAQAEPAASPRVTSLADAAKAGQALFTGESFGGSGTCETCHENGGRGPGHTPDGKALPSLEGAAAHYPRWAAKQQSVITLSGQINRCIAGALKGTPPAPGSRESVLLETYLASLSAGDVMGRQFSGAAPGGR